MSFSLKGKLIFSFHSGFIFSRNSLADCSHKKVAIVILSSCHYFGGKRIVGNGKIVTRDHTVGQFQRVEISGAMDVYIKQDSTQQPVKVVTDENPQDLIEIKEEKCLL